MGDVVCRKCGADPFYQNIVLTRVNPKGEKGIWECNPICGIPFENSESAIVYAIETVFKTEIEGTEGGAVNGLA